MANFFSRRWRSRGHGVHSPLAFRLVTEVLRQKYGYYADARLRSMGCKDLPEGMAGVIHRLACEFRPARIWIEDGLDHEPISDCVRLADSSVALSPSHEGADMLICAGAVAESMLPSEGIVILLSPPTSTHFPSVASGCMTFSNGHSIVAVMRPDLPRQHFEVRF